MASIVHRAPAQRRKDKLPFASPHGILFAIPASALLWVGILAAVGVLR